jgi:hypothetical protein
MNENASTTAAPSTRPTGAVVRAVTNTAVTKTRAGHRTNRFIVIPPSTGPPVRSLCSHDGRPPPRLPQAMGRLSKQTNSTGCRPRKRLPPCLLDLCVGIEQDVAALDSSPSYRETVAQISATAFDAIFHGEGIAIVKRRSRRLMRTPTRNAGSAACGESPRLGVASSGPSWRSPRRTRFVAAGLRNGETETGSCAAETLLRSGRSDSPAKIGNPSSQLG